MIVDPITMSPDQKISEALELMRHYRISGVPITKNKKLVGILTNRDLRFETRTDVPISEVMTRENLITVAGRHHADRGGGDPASSIASRSCWWSTITTTSRA